MCVYVFGRNVYEGHLCLLCPAVRARFRGMYNGVCFGVISGVVYVRDGSTVLRRVLLYGVARCSEALCSVYRLPCWHS